MAEQGFSYEDAVGASASPQGFSYEDAMTPVVASKSSVLSDIGSAVKNSAMDTGYDILQRIVGGQSSLPSAALQVMGGEAKAGLSGVGAGLNRVPGLPETIASTKGAVERGAQNVANAIDSPTTEDIATGTGNTVSFAGNKLSQVAKAHPEATANLEAFGNIGAAQGAAQVAKVPLEALENNVTGTAKAFKNAPWSAPVDADMAEFNADIVAPDKFPAKPSATSKYSGITSLDEEGNPIPSTTGPRAYYPDLLGANNALKENTSAGYAKSRALGAALTDDAQQQALTKVESDLGRLNDKLHPMTKGVLQVLKDEADENGLDLQTLDNASKAFGRVAYDATSNAHDIGAAKQGIKSINNIMDTMEKNPDMLQSGTPEAVSALKEGRAASGLQKDHDTIAMLVRNSAGDPEAMQGAFKSLYDDTDAFEKFSPQDQATIDYLAHPKKLNGLLKSAGKVGFGGAGNITPALAESFGALYNPAAAIPVLGGTAANLFRNRMVLRTADNLLKDMESRSIKISPITHDAEYEAAMARGEAPLSPQLALPAPEIVYVSPRGPIGGARALSPEEAASGAAKYQEYQNMGLDRATMDAQEAAKRSAFEREHPANEAFNKLRGNESPVSTSQTALHEPSTGIYRSAFPDEDLALQNLKDIGGGFKNGGAVQPTEAQKEAGNYKKEHVKIQGLDISIENPKGSVRSGKDKNGKSWECKLPCAYGYFKRSEGADGEHVDCFIGPNKHSLRVYVIDQKHHDSGKFDEHKCLLGFPTREEAIKAYRDSFSDKKNRIMHVRKMLMPEFKEWLKNGNTKKPIKHAA